MYFYFYFYIYISKMFLLFLINLFSEVSTFFFKQIRYLEHQNLFAMLFLETPFL